MENKMKRILFALGVAFLAVSAQAQTSITASAWTPLGKPCRLYDSVSALTALSTTYLPARGVCNIPPEATAISGTVAAVNPEGSGHGKIWESGTSQPTATSFNFRAIAGADSTGFLSVLCYPRLECAGQDLALFVSQWTRIIIDVTGYYTPLP